MAYDGPGLVWPPDTEPRECRRWDKRTQTWRWKVRFETRQDAASREGKGMALYVCSHCGFWHRACNPVST